MSSRLTYTDRFHQYALDGKRVDSVTTVIGKATAKPALIAWAARVAAEWAATHADELPQLGPDVWTKTAAGAANRARDAGAERGTRLHAAAEAMVWGDPLPEINPKTDAPYEWTDVERSIAEQIARFMDEWKVEPISLEVPVFHESHRWAGRPDLVADLSDGRRALIDWKTGASGIYPEQAIQLSTYAHATHIVLDGGDEPMHAVDWCCCVHVTPNGYEVIPTRNDDATYNVFRHMQVVARWASERREQYVGAALPVPEIGATA